ncbi:MAG: hypothetical protein FJX75_25540 [Armatimonadetes bacterium]|nr:hypothetical protein [Armatimonadota bacterium]
MRRLALAAAYVVLASVLLALVGGCSGTGAPTEPGDLAELQAVADAHLTAVLMVKSWFAILHTQPEGTTSAADAQSCTPRTDYLPPLPGDPPGSSRTRHTLEDCTVIETLWLADGSGNQTITDPLKGESKLVWQPLRYAGAWVVRPLRLELWNGAVMEYESGGLPGSIGNQRREIGNATLADGRRMDYTLRRCDTLDRLKLQPDDGSQLAVRVPLKFGLKTGYRPVFTDPAEGNFVDASGDTYSFRIAGSREPGWETWRFAAPDGTVGEFTIGGDFAGSGQFTSAGGVVAALRWQTDGVGVLRPVGASATQAVASAAARDFQIDQWIRNSAMLGPMPR